MEHYDACYIYRAAPHSCAIASPPIFFLVPAPGQITVLILRVNRRFSRHHSPPFFLLPSCPLEPREQFRSDGGSTAEVPASSQPAGSSPASAIPSLQNKQSDQEELGQPSWRPGGQMGG